MAAPANAVTEAEAAAVPPTDATALLAQRAAIDARGGSWDEKLAAFTADFHAHYPAADVAGRVRQERRARHDALIGEPHVHA